MASTTPYRSGLRRNNGLFFVSDKMSWQNLFSLKIEQAIEKIKPFAFFSFNKEPLILFFHNPVERKKIHKQCWNFNKAPIIIFLYGESLPIIDQGNELVFNLDENIEIYNGFEFNQNTEELVELTEKSSITDFSYFNLVSGKIWEKYENSFNPETKVDYNLLKNIEDARGLLIDKNNLTPIIVNRVIGRLIFIRYLIDRNVKLGLYTENNGFLSKEKLVEIIQNADELYLLFDYIKKFNGDLFPYVQKENGLQKQDWGFEKQELLSNSENLAILSHLFSGKIEIRTGQASLFDFYDFSIIPIEFVSNIYEYFIGIENQGKNKAFYTPSFLVDFILSETIEPFLKTENTWECKVLDPACGSGIFLVETLRKVIIKYKELHPLISVDDFKTEIKRILSENIFGIDKDGDAIDVAIFSLYVTLLDFIEHPKDVENFKFPQLRGKNFFQADFFENSFNEIENDFVKGLNNVRLNFIIGNPPWGRVSDSKYRRYAKERLKNEPRENERLKNVGFKNYKGENRKIEIINNNEISQGFLLRSKDFSSSVSQTRCALIVTSKILHNIYSDIFRNYFLNNVCIEKVVDFSAISEHLFIKRKGGKSTLGPAALLTFSWEDKHKISHNIIHHIAPKLNRFFHLLKIFVIEKHDYKKVLQTQFIKFDWLWKTMLYGNVLDFDFITSLKDEFKITVNDLTNDQSRFLYGGGLILGGGDKNPTDFLKNKALIDANSIDSFFRSPNLNTEWYLGNGKQWDRKFAHRSKKELFEKGLFDGDSLLIKKGLTSDYHLVAAFSKAPGVFIDTITGIKAILPEDVPLLKCLAGVLNSDFFSYYLFLTFSSAGVERKQAHNPEVFSLPFAFNHEIAEIASQITLLKEEVFALEGKVDNFHPEKMQHEYQLSQLKDETKILIDKLQTIIFSTYNLTDSQKELVNYSQDISIPLFKGDLNPIRSVERQELTSYANIFVKNFSHLFEYSNRHFQVEIFSDDFVIGMKFKILQTKPDQNIVYRADLKSLFIINVLSGISFQQITESIFIQKDIKIINRDSFSIIKPNEYKCWHKAVAYLDVNEFKRLLIGKKIEEEEIV